VEIAAFAVMSNHLHVLLRNRPDVVALWSDQELARRWLTLFPGRLGTKPDPITAPTVYPGPTADQAQAMPPGTSAPPLGGEPNDPREQVVALLTADPALLTTIRGRLSSRSWFLRALAEPIARRANKDDHCTGRFWEGRFQSQRLLDEAALWACSVYVDLNPIRAGLADRPETSELTSAHERIMALPGHPHEDRSRRRRGGCPCCGGGSGGSPGDGLGAGGHTSASRSIPRGPDCARSH
jgi:REP element-mobilizing transposase RayT